MLTNKVPLCKWPILLGTEPPLPPHFLKCDMVLVKPPPAPTCPFMQGQQSWKKELVPKHLVISSVEFVAQVDVSIYHQQSFMMQMANLKCVCHLPLNFTLSAAADYHHPQPWPMRMVGGTTTSVDNSKHTEFGPHNRCHQSLCEGTDNPH